MTVHERWVSFAQRTPVLKKCVAPIRPENRTVFIGGKYIDNGGMDAVVPEKYCDNTLTTSKYTVWNFIFKNLYEQFLRIANFYFLIVTIIMFCVPNTPVSPATSATPLVFVLFTTAVKQAYEDFLRHREDNTVNSRPYTIVKDGKLISVESYQIQVGDIVRVVDKEQFPCDLVLLSSSDDQGQCSIQTANLDGETNLKTFVCLPDTRELNTEDKLEPLRGVIDCQQPITDLYKFIGKMTIYSSSASPITKALQADNVLLRGAKLKNTDYIYGCAIYTGHDTKLALNSAIKSGKRSSVERRLNTFLIVFVIYMVIQCAVSAGLRHGSLANIWKREDNSRPQWYIPFIFDYSDSDGMVTVKQTVIDVLYFYIIYNYVIPISLYVTIELQKFVGSIFFGFDKEMYDEKLNERAKANTSDLNEELGQVEYLFCDKTGTLTENDMEFRQCSINGTLYTEENGQFVRNHALESLLNAEKEARQRIRNGSVKQRGAMMSEKHKTHVESKAESETTEDVVDGAENTESFFEVLSLCHTVQIEQIQPAPTNGELSQTSNTLSSHLTVNGNTKHEHGEDVVDNKVSAHSLYTGVGLDDITGMSYEYHASSPDEKALVEACRLFGVVYHGTSDNKLHITFKRQSRYFTVHQLLEFDSDRKCMTVIIETDKGEYKVLCKGAESSVLKKCISGPIDTTIEHVDYYASLGLRTLVIAGKTVDEEEFKRLMHVIESAKQDLNNRDAALAAAFADVEQGFHVIGATAVEDKLQDGVKETISKLRDAGIKVWVLTGDKEETAVNISHSAGHFDDSMTLLGFTMQTTEADAYSNLLNLKDSLKGIAAEGNQAALVVDGSSLAMILNRYSEEFRDICMACPAVLCCRMTPIQKAKIVKLVKESSKKPTTAAIGDGANDVSMIQEAHVGIGILGKEGRQAARSSDYAFGRFRFLLRALLVHGHFYYVRLAVLVQYFFYKNVAFITANFYFIFFSAYSAVSVFDTIFLTFYNVTFTSLPIYLYGLFEQHIPPQMLLDNPRLYKEIKDNKRLSTPNFIMWTLLAIWHSACASFGIYLMYVNQSEFSTGGHQTDFAAYGTAIIFIATTSVNIKLMIETYYWTWLTLIGYLITFICNWAMIAIYCNWAYVFSPSNTSMVGILGQLFGSGVFWLTALLLTILSLVPDLAIRTYNDLTNPIYVTISRSRAMSNSTAPAKHLTKTSKQATWILMEEI